MQKITPTQILNPSQFSQVNDLWNREYPLKLMDRFPLLLEGVSRYNHYIIEDEMSKVLAWAVDFEKDNELRFSVIVDGNVQGKGLGTQLLNRLKSENDLFYGWVIDHDKDIKANGQNYISPLNFYISQGFEVLHDQRINNDMLSAVKVRWKNSIPKDYHK